MDFLMFHSVRISTSSNLKKMPILWQKLSSYQAIKEVGNKRGKEDIYASGVCTIGKEIFKELSNTISVL